MKVTVILKYDIGGRSLHREASVEFEPTHAFPTDIMGQMAKEPTQYEQAADQARQLFAIMADELARSEQPCPPTR